MEAQINMACSQKLVSRELAARSGTINQINCGNIFHFLLSKPSLAETISVTSSGKLWEYHKRCEILHAFILYGYHPFDSTLIQLARYFAAIRVSIACFRTLHLFLTKSRPFEGVYKEQQARRHPHERAING